MNEKKTELNNKNDTQTRPRMYGQPQYTTVAKSMIEIIATEINAVCL